MTPVTRRTPFEDLPDMLRVEEYAAYHGIGRGLAYAQVKSGKIPHVTFGRLIRIPKTALAAQAAVK